MLTQPPTHSTLPIMTHQHHKPATDTHASGHVNVRRPWRTTTHMSVHISHFGTDSGMSLKPHEAHPDTIATHISLGKR